MGNQKKDSSFYFEGRGPIGGNRESVEILKTYPTLDDLNRVAMTDMEFQYSTDGGSSWQALSVENVGLPGVIGAFKRTVSLPSNTYSFRCRCLNGALVGAWETINNITVN